MPERQTPTFFNKVSLQEREDNHNQQLLNQDKSSHDELQLDYLE